MEEKNKEVHKRKWPRRVIISLIVFVLIFSLISIIMVRQVYDSNFPRANMREYLPYLRYTDVSDTYSRREISFYSDNNRLTGYVYGESADKALIIISHGLGGGSEGYMAETIAFVDAGYRVLAFDNTGSHASEGESNRGLPQSVIDLNAALTFVENDTELGTLPVLLYGHSWGGYAVTAVLNYEHPNVKGSVSVAGYNSPMGLLYEQARSMMGAFATIEYPFLWGYQRFLFGEAADLTAVDGINKSGIPVMIIHGTEDEAITIDGAGIMAQRDKIANPSAKFVTRDEEGLNGHVTLFISDEAAKYSIEKSEVWDKLDEEYDGNIPKDIEAEYYDNIDKTKMSQLDEQYLETVLAFFKDALGNS